MMEFLTRNHENIAHKCDTQPKYIQGVSKNTFTDLGLLTQKQGESPYKYVNKYYVFQLVNLKKVCDRWRCVVMSCRLGDSCYTCTTVASLSVVVS